MRLRRGLRDHVHDRAVGVDDERRAVHAHVRLAVHLLLAPDAVLLGDGVVRVGEQREVEVLLVVELRDRRDRVGRDAEHGHAGGLVVAAVVADAARLRRAPGGVGLGIEVEDDGPAAQAREAHGGAVVVGELEVGGLVAGLDHGRRVSGRARGPDAAWRHPGRIDRDIGGEFLQARSRGGFTAIVAVDVPLGEMSARENVVAPDAASTAAAGRSAPALVSAAAPLGRRSECGVGQASPARGGGGRAGARTATPTLPRPDNR